VRPFRRRAGPAGVDDVHILGEPAGGLGYVAGNSAVAVALATVASPYLGRRSRRVAWALAPAVANYSPWMVDAPEVSRLMNRGLPR
jgi:hypothetical protein